MEHSDMEPIKYIAQNSRDREWGLTVCSVGHQKIAAGEEYPPRKHNQEYMFDPEHGRILSEYQLIYIVDGQGTLTTRSAGEMKVKGGDMFILFPGEWHSYRPDEGTGWNEYWIGFEGINIDNRVQAGFFTPGSPLFHIGYDEFMVSLYNEAIRTAMRQEPYFQQLLAGVVNHLLGLMFMTGRKSLLQNDTEAMKIVNMAKNAGHKIFAVGATVVRAIETPVTTTRQLKPFDGWTNKFIFPPYQFSIPDAVITNFHLPNSTMLMSAASFGGYDNVMKAYRTALKEGYQFGMYGDAMLIID